MYYEIPEVETGLGQKAETNLADFNLPAQGQADRVGEPRPQALGARAGDKKRQYHGQPEQDLAASGMKEAQRTTLKAAAPASLVEEMDQV